MVSSKQSSSLKESLSPFIAIVEADLKNLFKSKLTYGWVVAALFLEVIRVLGSRAKGESSTVIGSGLSDFLLIWSLIIIGLTASSISSEAGEFADSIMSKSVTRFDYILAKFSSRIIYVLTVYGAIVFVLAGLSIELVSDDYQPYGLVYSILLVALALITLTTLGVSLSTFAPNTIIAIIGLLVVWYFMTFFFPLINLGFLSPSTLSSDLPGNIRNVWSVDEWKTVVGYAGISLVALVSSMLYFHLKDI